jgi:hypothetical protein
LSVPVLALASVLAWEQVLVGVSALMSELVLLPVLAVESVPVLAVESVLAWELALVLGLALV